MQLVDGEQSVGDAIHGIDLGIGYGFSSGGYPEFSTHSTESNQEQPPRHEGDFTSTPSNQHPPIILTTDAGSLFFHPIGLNRHMPD